MFELKGKKVLLMGLGILGGGVGTAKWLLKQGVKLTITDIKTEDELENSLKQLAYRNDKINFKLGGHDEKDFLENEIIVVNPDVPLSSPYLNLARENNKEIENELTLFWKFSPTKNIIAVTGTRGKTTTANWIGYFLRLQYPEVVVIGNSPENPLLASTEVFKKNTPVVVEIPSFLLEHTAEAGFKPKIALITNVYRDHLNRYHGLDHYALTKAEIFKNQSSEDALVLNQDNAWTPFFIDQNPKSKIFFFSKKEPPSGDRGIFLKDTQIFLKNARDKDIFFYDAGEFIKKWGSHNLENLLAAIMTVLQFGIPENLVKENINNLPQIKYREELVYITDNIEIYNDTSATSPEATMAALERFGHLDNLILVTGGTDRNLEYSEWSESIKRYMNPDNLIFLNGSATKRMIEALGWKRVKVYEGLEECFKSALEIAKNYKNKSIILFSPAAKSFEKFKNEFDRGKQFNGLVGRFLK